jgi:4-amino-4-deoxy-L-arabinose transferase-like glycosyltransferase
MTPSGRLGLLAVLLVAAAARAGNYLEIRGSPLLHFHRWAQSDMSFFDAWARAITAGDLLTRATLRPYHTAHARLAREAHARSGSPEPFDDAVGKRIWREWLGEGTFYQDPLYAYVVAAIYAVAGPRVGAVFLVQALLGLATVALVHRLACRLFDARVAVVAGLLAALYGPLLFYETLLLRDSMITFTGLATLWAFIRAADRPDERRPAVLAGAVSGLGFLLKSTSLLFSAAAAAIVAPLGRTSPVRRVAWIAAGFLAATAPLAARNVALGVAPFRVVSERAFPFVFIGANAEDYDPMAGGTVSTHTVDILARTDGRWLPVVVETLRTHDGLAGWPRLLGGKLLAFWQWYEIPDNADYAYYRLHAPLVSAITVRWGLVAPLAVVGLVLAARRAPAYLLAAAYLAAVIATNVIFFTVSRYRLPAALAMTPFAAFALVALAQSLLEGRRLRVATLLALTAAVAVAVLRPLGPGRLTPRIADFGVANEIAGHLARRAAQAGDLDGALRLLERQLETEPPELRAVDPRSGVTPLSVLAGTLAGSFAPLHELAGGLFGARGASEASAEHLRRARVLGIVASQFAAGLLPGAAGDTVTPWPGRARSR